MSAREPIAGPFVGRTLTVLGLTALALAVVLVLWSAREIFLLAFAGVLLAVLLNAPARFAAGRTRLPYGRALAAFIALVLILTVGGVWLLGPSVSEQVVQLVEQLPSSVEQAREAVSSVPIGAWLLERLQGRGGPDPSGSDVVSTVTGTATAVGDVVTKAIFVLFFGLFLAFSPRRYRDGIVRLFPPSRRPHAREAIGASFRSLQGWLLGQLLAMAIVGTVTGLGLWAIGVPLALVLGIIAGLAEFVPIIGPIVGFVPAALLALSQGTTQLLWVVGLFLAIQLLEGNVVVPLIQQRTVDLPPALTLAAVFVAGALFGTVGLLIASPLLAVLLVLVKLLYLRDVLGERVELPGAR